MTLPRVPPSAFIVPTILICSATSVVTVLMMRKAVSTSATSESTRMMVKMPSSGPEPKGALSVL